MALPLENASKTYKLISEDGTRFIFTEHAIKQFYRYEFHFRPVEKGGNKFPYMTSTTLQLIKNWCDNDYQNPVVDLHRIPGDFSVSMQAQGFVDSLGANFRNLLIAASRHNIMSLWHCCCQVTFDFLKKKTSEELVSLVPFLVEEDSDDSDMETDKNPPGSETPDTTSFSSAFLNMEPRHFLHIFARFVEEQQDEFAQCSEKHEELLTRSGVRSFLRSSAENILNEMPLQGIRNRFCWLLKANPEEFAKRFRHELCFENGRISYKMFYQLDGMFHQQDGSTFAIEVITRDEQEIDSCSSMMKKETFSIANAKCDLMKCAPLDSCPLVYYYFSKDPIQQFIKIILFSWDQFPLHSLSVLSIKDSEQFSKNMTVAANYMNEIGQQIRCLHIGDRVIQSNGLIELLRRVEVQQLTAIYTPLIAPSFPLFHPKCDILIINSAHWMSVQQLKDIDVRDVHIYGTNFSCEDMAMYLEWFVSTVYNKLEDLKLGLRENRDWRRILSRMHGQAVKNKQIRRNYASFECIDGTKVVLGPLENNLDPKMIQMKVSRPED